MTCPKNKVQNIKSIKKTRNTATGKLGGEVKYINDKGEEKGAGFANFEKNFEENCSKCGRKKFKCRLNKAEQREKEDKDVSSTRKRVEKEDITARY